MSSRESGPSNAWSKVLANHHAITVLTQGHSNPFVAKTAASLLRYRGTDVAAILDDQARVQTAGELFSVPGDAAAIPVVSELPAESDALYIGIAPPGGLLPLEWKPIILAAIERQMDVVSGLHDFLDHDPDYVAAAKASEARLIDVRRNDFRRIATGQPFRRDCLRIHTVGQDCSVGKMVATLEIDRGLRDRGLDSQFLATGQTGIMVAGHGIPIDCVVADFVNGAAEQLVREQEQHDYLLIEGQGSISHPAYSAVTLGLLHGSQPDGLVFCYEAGRHDVKGLQGLSLPEMDRQLECLRQMAEIRHPSTLIGFAINTRHLSADDAAAETRQVEKRYGLPACDVYRDGADKLVEACVHLKQKQKATT